MLSKLNETNDTRFGLSRGKPQGKGVSGKQAFDLYSRLRESSAVKTGFITELADCELLIPGISRDKISDITTKIIKKKLIEYTMHQCYLLGINIKGDISSDYFWNYATQEWVDDYFPLPLYDEERIILVPKAIARYDFSYDYQEYYNHFILNYLQVEHLNASSSLVRTLKKGNKVVYKRDLKDRFPCSKEFIYDFSKAHPDVLRKYKHSKKEKLKDLTNRDITSDLDEREIAKSLCGILKSTTPGDQFARQYHDLMVGILEFIFYPYLICPRKEKEIHEGRKRIDIVFTNAAREGFFYLLHSIHRIPCIYIMVECKNYNSDPNNPELDQLSGRFSPNRGIVGFLVCRYFTNKKLFIQRCKDTAVDQRGYIVPLDDEDIIHLLLCRADNNDKEMDTLLNDRFREIIMG